MNAKKPKSPTKADLGRKVVELEAQLASTYHFASVQLKNAGDRNQGGAVVLRIHGLGGRELIPPVAIKNGLSDETIECLKKDILRSWESAVEFKPLGASLNGR